MRRAGLFWLLVPTLAAAAIPPEGVPLQARRGFFTETDIGVFLTVGGDDRYSNAQTYLQLGLGYDLLPNVEVGAHFGLSSSAANCFSGRTPQGCPLAQDFTVGFVNLSVAYLARLSERFYLAPKITGGYTRLDPAPALSDSGKPITSAANVGGGFGIEYVTSLDHFTIGADVLARWIIGPSISGIAFFPRVKYTF